MVLRSSKSLEKMMMLFLFWVSGVSQGVFSELSEKSTVVKKVELQKREVSINMNIKSDPPLRVPG